VLIAMFYIVDSLNYRRAPKGIREKIAEPPDQWRFQGLSNLVFLAVILGAVFVEKPRFVREALMIGAAVGSYCTTRRSIHESNDFNFHPVKEVAILFAGIFATMMPALQWLELNSSRFGGANPSFYYWGTGSLSGILDNAPTYLGFLSASFGALLNGEVVQQLQTLVQNGGAGLDSLTGPHSNEVRMAFAALQKYHGAQLAERTMTKDQIAIALMLANPVFNKCIIAISVGAVFFGASTYIGNGPNFMVKVIADQQRVPSPGFVGYIVKYTLPFLMTMLVIVWLIFFRQK
jgi:Na+/H+ antiporter NhaD/arsenite permease-like protein